MIVITHNGEYAKVTKVMSNHFEVTFFNGKSTLINKNSCEELVPEHHVTACREQLEMHAKELKKMYEKIQIANKIAKDYINEYKDVKTAYATGGVLAMRDFLIKYNQ